MPGNVWVDVVGVRIKPKFAVREAAMSLSWPGVSTGGRNMAAPVIPATSRFVCMYLSTRTGEEVPVYVGRGTVDRVADHGTTDPNAELAAIIAGGEYAVEVLDCGDRRSGLRPERTRREAHEMNGYVVEFRFNV